MTTEERIKEACDFIDSNSKSSGGQAQLARELGLTPQQLNNWKKRGIPHYFKVNNPDLFK